MLVREVWAELLVPVFTAPPEVVVGALGHRARVRASEVPRQCKRCGADAGGLEQGTTIDRELGGHRQRVAAWAADPVTRAVVVILFTCFLRSRRHRARAGCHHDRGPTSRARRPSSVLHLPLPLL